MKSQTDCCFCDIIKGRYRYKNIDEPIAENREFIACASIGAMVEGWTLIISKDHRYSMKSFYQNPMLSNITKQISKTLNNTYGSVIAFEHGATRKGSRTGCGIDHAHLHIVPLNSITPELEASGLKWTKCPPKEVASLAGRNEYLFYTDLGYKNDWLNTAGFLHVLEYPISQFFRRIIGKKLGKIELTDYKAFPYFENAIQTKNTFAEVAAYF